MDEFIPTKNSTTRHNLPWYNSRLCRMSRKLQKLYNKQKKSQSETDKDIFKLYRTTYKKELPMLKLPVDIDKTMSDNYHQNTNKFWKITKSKKVDNTRIPPLNHNNTTIHDSKEKTEIFNKYFHSVNTQEDLTNILSMKGDPTPDITPINITSEGVRELLLKLEANKASGPDHIPARLLKECADEIVPLLATFFTQSLHSGNLPPDWLMSNISLIHKKGNKSSPPPNKYSLISLTSICCKLMEHVLASHIMDHLDFYNVLHDSQHASGRGEDVTHS